MLAAMLNYDQLQVAVAAARRQFELLKKKYPNLKAHLVLSSPGGQIEIDSSPAHILDHFPAMIMDDANKAQALKLNEPLKLEIATGAEAAHLKKQLDQLSPKFKYDGTCQIEIRGSDLKYDLIWKLQTDDLVDRRLTPQTKASIRIVLGTLAHFERSSE